nr:MAG TPA: immunity protein [Caudoviricetes sp.]
MVCRTNDCNGFRAVVFSGFCATLVATLVMSKLSCRWIVGDWSKAQIPDKLLFTPYAIGVGVLFLPCL